MSFQHTTYNRAFLTHIQTNHTPQQPDPKYNVRLQPATVAADTHYWRLIGVHHLTPEENGSRHNAFVEVLDEQGRRVRDPNLKIGWTWEGRSEPDLTTPLDKPDNEPAGDVPIQKGMRLALWITGDGNPSDRVTNLHFEHDDERTAAGEIWNSYGHHSFYCVFQRTTKAQNGAVEERPREIAREPADQPPRNGGREGGGGQPDPRNRDGVTPEPHTNGNRSTPPIPNIFTNQHLINAFFFTASTLGVVGDDLMRKAGLDVHGLAADEATRLAGYRGVTLQEMPNLTSHERTLIARNLLLELRNARGWSGQVNAQAGLNLRDKPNTTDSTVLTTLSNGTPVDVLHENGAWLFVAADAETAGFAAGQYVARRTERVSGPPVGAPEAPLTGTYFRSDAEARSVPLAPDDGETIVLGPTAGPGARNLTNIWNRYGGLLTLLANRLQIDAAVAVAVLAVESGGAAFGADGRMIIRFENHLFYRDWGEQHQEKFFQHFDFNRATNESWLGHRWRPSPQAAFIPMHPNTAEAQGIEWRVFNFAKELDDTAAKRAISMGAPQILGSNHARIGYPTVQAMFDAFMADERNHILGLFDFIRSDGDLVDALRRQDFAAFVAGYNGSGQVAFYQGKLTDALRGINLLHSAPAHATFEPTTSEEPPLPAELDANLSFLPLPELPGRLISVIDVPEEEQVTVDPRLQAIRIKVMEAWAEHMEQGLQNNTIMFSQLLKAFMRPYYMTIIMYTLLFLVGVGLFVVAAWLSIGEPERNYFALLFGGLGLATFLAFFISRPLAALEENLLLITRLGVIYNTYWTRLLYMQDTTTVQAELEDATIDAITELDKLTDKSTELAQNRPGLGVR